MIETLTGDNFLDQILLFGTEIGMALTAGFDVEPYLKSWSGWVRAAGQHTTVLEKAARAIRAQMAGDVEEWLKVKEEVPAPSPHLLKQCQCPKCLVKNPC